MLDANLSGNTWGRKIRIVEKPGQKWIDILKMTIKKRKRKCGNKNCLVNNTEKGGDCKKNECIYKMKCKTCGMEYFGESHRNSHSRSLEHVRDSKAKIKTKTVPSDNNTTGNTNTAVPSDNKTTGNNTAFPCDNNTTGKDDKIENEAPKSVILRHQLEVHNGEKVEFDMKVVKSFQNDPLARQIGEGICIREMDPDKRINNKQEWNQPEDIFCEYKKNDNKDDMINKCRSRKAEIDNNNFVTESEQNILILPSDRINQRKITDFYDKPKATNTDYTVQRTLNMNQNQNDSCDTTLNNVASHSDIKSNASQEPPPTPHLKQLAPRPLPLTPRPLPLTPLPSQNVPTPGKRKREQGIKLEDSTYDSPSKKVREASNKNVDESVEATVVTKCSQCEFSTTAGNRGLKIHQGKKHKKIV